MWDSEWQSLTRYLIFFFFRSRIVSIYKEKGPYTLTFFDVCKIISYHKYYLYQYYLYIYIYLWTQSYVAMPAPCVIAGDLCIITVSTFLSHISTE